MKELSICNFHLMKNKYHLRWYICILYTMNILVISDNQYLLERFDELLLTKDLYNLYQWDFACSASNKALQESGILLTDELMTVDVKKEWETLSDNYDLIFSLHCKQLFPAELVEAVKCINIHPGFNPYNRGWYPQVFSILNKKKAGATIHEIDNELDHGPIIAQKEVTINKWDTSLSAYNKILEAELELLDEYLEKIISGNYTTQIPSEEGNLNLKKDFNTLTKIDLSKVVSFNDAIDFLRAMTHGSYNNAWFIDPESGKKIFVSINLKTEDII